MGAVITLYAALRIWYDGELRLRYFAIAGFFAAFTASAELPALSLFALLSAALLWRFPRPTLIAYTPAALVIVIAFFATNWLAHRSFIPPYAHREHDKSTDSPANYYQNNLTLDSGQTVTLRGNPTNWYDYEFSRTDGRIAQSYWRSPKGIDAGEPSIAKYALNLLVGHHGIFSLTPDLAARNSWRVFAVAGPRVSAPRFGNSDCRHQLRVHHVLHSPPDGRTQLRGDDFWLSLGILAGAALAAGRAADRR